MVISHARDEIAHNKEQQYGTKTVFCLKIYINNININKNINKIYKME